jgi:alpha-amylase/alpha-mannosidase (GH57 family)
MSDRAFCVHGHFYQPPREDPLTGVIPIEPGAAPFSNWNERIVEDCYRPNAEAGNFGNLSFNLGPTLSEWLEQNHPSVIQRAIADDGYNQNLRSAGNAMAQSFHHTILPLASRQDKLTQVRWGINDFAQRFNRPPQGMWLPETAVDMETLEVLSQLGIRFTILAPWQAATEIEPGQPYLVELRPDRSMTVFFYDQELSSGISFDQGFTSNADEFVKRRLMSKYSTENKAQLILVATDGELYGHHQKFRYKFLQQLFSMSLKTAGIQAVYPELWLKGHPAKDRVEIRDKTSWSCMHDLLRWSGTCACTPHPEWKAPLRAALNEVAEIIDQIFIEETRHLVKDPWRLRDMAIIIRDPQFDLQSALTHLGVEVITRDETKRLSLLLKSQFERQRMFASCAWFFEDFDRIEPQNAVRYAASAIHLTQKATGSSLVKDVFPLFEKVRSSRVNLNAALVFMDFLERVTL